ncbi:MAG: GNAT family N-acetyltransferase [Caldilinea sp.]|nr:GNAT family N-acetyltransferase [Caldilinea sp.]MCB0056901.1 GNAT family N-acetyltransferase [Caldilineaceae bacterium]MCB0048265.1 GNAT family N-acetyltransferase [Caldilinea sp.]MCB0067608.1 GNAT family N-acetyltransferase [Caldilineaceae bacterium]MCB0151208.1 GNAT family N-acetyltransferase [Caldilineaceae bacterium]
MEYHFAPMTEPDARAVLNWSYPGIDTLYNPDPDNLEEDMAALLRPDYYYHAIRDGAGGLVGFCCFGEDAQVPGGDYGLPALDVGLGLHPDLIGTGLSHGFLAAILAFGEEKFAPEFFRATVAVINRRSLHLFERAGFYIVQNFLSGEVRRHRFYVLLRAVAPEERFDPDMPAPGRRR